MPDGSVSNSPCKADDCGCWVCGPYMTQSGAVLTQADLGRLADEAERGYCTELVTRDSVVARCFEPMPCAEHAAGLERE
jgi:hypothetical protein